MFSLNKDTASIAVALLIVATCYYLFSEVKKQRGDIERCKTFSIELAQQIHQPPMNISRPPPHKVTMKTAGMDAVDEAEEPTTHAGEEEE
jgi:hypothetical protein